MGQASSNHELHAGWNVILQKITREDILRASSRCRAMPPTDDIGPKRVYIDDDAFDIDDHVSEAIAILQTHPQLKDVRFRLVPSRLSEETFWAAIFSILYSRDGEVREVGDTSGGVADDYVAGDEIDDRVVPNEMEHLRSHHEAQSPSSETEYASSGNDCDGDNSNPGLYASPSFYVEELHEQTLVTARLQKSLREANHMIRKLGLDLHKARQSEPEEQPSVSITTCEKCHDKLGEQLLRHVGKWKMHKDCGEFLELDEHLKDNLRKEKEKRLNDVRAQMRFILDSDDVRDTYGEWSCCGEEEYDASGCA